MACKSRHGPDLRGLDDLLAAHVRKNAGQALCQHGLARAGRAHDQNVVAARCRNLKGTLDVFLPLHVGKIQQRIRRRREGRSGRRGKRLFAAQMPDKLRDRAHPIDLQPFGKGSLAGVLRRDKEAAQPLALGGQGHGQRALHGAQLPGEAELPDESGVILRLMDVPGGSKDAHQDRQVIDRAGLFLVRRGEVYDETGHREAKAAVFHRGVDPLPGFLDRRVRQAHNVEMGQAVGDIDLHRHPIAADAADPEALDR